MYSKFSFFNGAFGFTAIFSFLLNISEVLDMLVHHLIKLLVIVFLSIVILFVGSILLARKSTNSLKPESVSIEKSKFFKVNWMRLPLVTLCIVLLVVGALGLYQLKTAPVYYVVLTEKLNEENCTKIKTTIENSGIDLNNHTIHYEKTGLQLFLKPAYFNEDNYFEAESQIKRVLEDMKIKEIKIHKSKPFNPVLKKKIRYLNEYLGILVSKLD